MPDAHSREALPCPNKRRSQALSSPILCFFPQRPKGAHPGPFKSSKAPPLHLAKPVDRYLKRPHTLDPLSALGIRQVGERIYCGARPDAAMLEELKRAGVRTIINLEDYHTYWGWFGWRTRALAQEADINMVRQPISPLFWVSKRRVKNIIDILADSSRGPFYVHCLFGKERTNLVVALHRRVNESLSKKVVRRAMYQDGFRPQLVPLLASQVDDLLAYPQKPPTSTALALSPALTSGALTHVVAAPS